MIITLKGANFKDSNIGTLSTWTISRVLGDGATYNGVTYVDKNAAFEATVTIAEGYDIGAAGVTVTMGGVGQTYTIVGNVITINIAQVTGNVVIKVPTVNTSTGDESGGNEESEAMEYILLDTDGNAKLAYYQALKLHGGDSQMYFTTEFPTSAGYINKDGTNLDQSTWAGTAKKYCCTILFTPETLPVGSTISIADGWLYRMNYWTSENSYGNRDNNATTGFTVDETFWNNKVLVGFNIATNPASDLSVSQRQQIANHEVFTITFA